MSNLPLITEKLPCSCFLAIEYKIKEQFSASMDIMIIAGINFVKRKKSALLCAPTVLANWSEFYSYLISLKIANSRADRGLKLKLPTGD